MLVVTHRFPVHPASVAAARRAADRLLAAANPRDADDVRIVASELVTATLVSSGGGANGWIDLTLKVSRGGLRIEVRDGGPAPGEGRAAPSRDDALSATSRHIVEGLAESWGTDPGTGLWADVIWDGSGPASSPLDRFGKSLSLGAGV